MDSGDAARLETLLVGASLPADKSALLEHAVRQHAEPQLLEALRSIPDREYRSLDEVVEELLHVQPPRAHDDAQQPREESGQPPGGADYTNPHPDDTGRVRDA